MVTNFFTVCLQQKSEKLHFHNTQRKLKTLQWLKGREYSKNHNVIFLDILN